VRPSRHGVFFGLVFVIVAANYLAQIIYYLHQYYVPHGAHPALAGTAALTATLLWFLAGFFLLRRGIVAGYLLLLLYLVAMTGFYLYNMLNQMAHGFAPFFHLQNPDPALWTVFAIGYLNMLAGILFIAYLVWQRHRLPPANHPTARRSAG
jgi:hypothetical protein